MSQIKAQKIFIAGHQGMVGSALVRLLQKNTNNEIIADAIRSVKIEPRVAVTDINNVQSDIVRVDSLTNL